MLLYDASIDEDAHGIPHLKKTDFGNDKLSAMRPYEGCYIHAYQHNNKCGHSRVCSSTDGCDYFHDPMNNQFTSVYCYCNAPVPRICGTIYEQEDLPDLTSRPYLTTHFSAILDDYTSLYDGAQIGVGFWSSMNWRPRYVPNDSLSTIHVQKGCHIDIWQHPNKKGNHFRCSGSEAEYWCRYNDLGKVGNNKASTITCECPVEFDSIKYDNENEQYIPDIQSSPSLTIHTMIIQNDCDPDIQGENVCADVKQTTTQTIEVKTQHDWGQIFKAGVTYSKSTEATLFGFGFSSTSFTFDTEISSGGLREFTETLGSTQECVAKPMTRAICRYVAYKGEIEENYTIYWKNASPTRGKYKGTGWVVQLHYSAEALDTFDINKPK